MENLIQKYLELDEKYQRKANDAANIFSEIKDLCQEELVGKCFKNKDFDWFAIVSAHKNILYCIEIDHLSDIDEKNGDETGWTVTERTYTFQDFFQPEMEEIPYEDFFKQLNLAWRYFKEKIATVTVKRFL